MKLNYNAKTIELTSTEMKNAMNYGSDAYNALQAARRDYPNFKVVEVKSKRNKNDFSDAGVMKTVVAIRQYSQKLGFSQEWTTDFVYKVVMLAKKEPRPKE